MGSCNLCGSPRSQVVHVGAGPRADADVHRCLGCDHHYLGQWVAEFEEDLYAYYATFRSREQVYGALNAARHRELLDELGRSTGGKRFLDVGCGAGQMVDTATRAGWSALGIDLAAPAIEVCKRFSVPCRLLDFFDPELDGARFDVIHMSELIEHVPTPARFVTRAADLLAPGGVLYLTTPNHGALSRRLLGAAWPAFSREHVSYFTQSSLSRLLLAEHRLEAVSVTSRNLAVFTIAAELRRRAGSALGARARPRPAVAAGGADQQLRRGLASSAVLRTVKDAANGILGVTRAGETLVGLARRRL